MRGKGATGKTDIVKVDIEKYERLREIVEQLQRPAEERIQESLAKFKKFESQATLSPIGRYIRWKLKLQCLFDWLWGK